jgi:hypothetical protein
MPTINKYIIVDINSKKYYCSGHGTTSCEEKINNAQVFTEYEYRKYRERSNYLNPTEKFVKIDENGELIIIS